MTTTLPLYLTRAASVLKTMFAGLAPVSCTDTACDKRAAGQEPTAFGRRRADAEEVRDPFRKA